MCHFLSWFFFCLFRQFFHGKKAFVWLITLTTNTRDHCWLHLDNINFPFDTFKPHLFVSKRQRIKKKEEKNRSCDESGRCDNVVFMNKNNANSSCVGQEENNTKRWSKNIKKIVISCFFYTSLLFFCCTAIHWNVCVYAAMGKGKEESN